MSGLVDESMKSDGFLTPELNSVYNPITNCIDLDEYRLSGALDEEYCCPCCNLVCAGGINYHNHITNCFMTRHIIKSIPNSPVSEDCTDSDIQDHNIEYNNNNNSSSPFDSPLTYSSSLTNITENGNKNELQLASFRACVGQLDIDQRISLMEAFNRLSRTTAELNENNTSTITDNNNHNNNNIINLSRSSTSSPKPYDEKVLTLLYSPSPSTQKRSTTTNSTSSSPIHYNNSSDPAQVLPSPIKRNRSIPQFNSTLPIQSSFNSNLTQPQPRRMLNTTSKQQHFSSTNPIIPKSVKSSKNIFSAIDSSNLNTIIRPNRKRQSSEISSTSTLSLCNNTNTSNNNSNNNNYTAIFQN